MNPTTDQLTAYALGEGTAAERAAIAAYLATHPDAQAEVAAVQQAAALISDSLLQESAPGLDQDRKDALATLRRPALRTRRLRLPPWLGVIATGAAAATIAIAVVPTPEPAPGTPVWATETPRATETARANKHESDAVPRADTVTSTAERAPATPSTSVAAPSPGPAAVFAGASVEQTKTGIPAPVRIADAKTKQSAIAPTSPLSKRDHHAQSASQQGFLPVTSMPPIEAESATDGEGYHALPSNGWHRVSSAADDANRLSTFGADVDTASYANVRRFLRNGQLPPPEAVRAEELINAFSYHYTPPNERRTPFAVHADTASCPWDDGHRLVRIGLKGYELDAATRPPANLVFLVDVSGSMNQPNKLPLVQRSLTLLTQQLRPDDRVAIVTYAGAAGLRLDSTTGENKAAILAGIDGLSAGGSTNGAGGISLAYEVAKRSFIRGGANRVVLCTDGDFNVGFSSRENLERLITEQATSGVFLTALGFGMGNFQDATLQALANKGNGQYAYIDGEAEARKHLVEGCAGTLVTIAKDLKLQVEFNPATVAAWRLIGYEKRGLAHRDFLDDAKDAGELGAGHTVTALYEIEPAGALPVLRYAVNEVAAALAEAPAKPRRDELLTVNLRWKLPDGLTSTGMAVPVTDDGQPGDADTRFAAAVAEFAAVLRQEPGTWELGRVLRTAQETAGKDAQRLEFIDLVRSAQQLKR
jgi:Ca-activated chloride channel homolog